MDGKEGVVQKLYWFDQKTSEIDDFKLKSDGDVVSPKNGFFH